MCTQPQRREPSVVDNADVCMLVTLGVQLVKCRLSRNSKPKIQFAISEHISHRSWTREPLTVLFLMWLVVLVSFVSDRTRCDTLMLTTRLRWVGL